MTGRVYGYVRVSSLEQTKSGLGLESQIRAVMKIQKELKDPFGRSRWPPLDDEDPSPCEGMFVDRSVSAYQGAYFKLFERPAGSMLHSVLMPGDTVIVSRLDRLVRNVSDFCNLMAEAKKNNWRIICGFPRIDLGTATGRAMAMMSAVVAQWESDRRSERIRVALAIKAAGGRREYRKQKAVSEPSEYRNLKSGKPEASKSGGTVYIYARASHRSSVKSGLGIKNQIVNCLEYAANLAEQNEDLQDGGVHLDKGVSAMKHGFFYRPVGEELNNVLERGDHIVIYNLDRAFRGMRDFAETTYQWSSRGITLHIVDIGLNTSDPMGLCMVGVIASLAECEVHLCSMRAQEARATLATQGKYVGGDVPAFWKLYQVDGIRRLILDPKQLAEFRMIKYSIHRGMSMSKALDRCEEVLARRASRPVIPKSGVKRLGRWSGISPLLIPGRRQGKLFPVWTKTIYQLAAPAFERTMEMWRKQRREDKESLKLLLEKRTMARIRAEMKQREKV